MPRSDVIVSNAVSFACSDTQLEVIILKIHEDSVVITIIHFCLRSLECILCFNVADVN